MYRGTTLASAVSKLFELVLLELFRNSLKSDILQYGFKRESDCAHALFAFSESIPSISVTQEVVVFSASPLVQIKPMIEFCTLDCFSN